MSLRRATDGDRDFLRGVYASTRAEELAVVEWPPGRLEAFVRMQFDAQDAWWAGQRPSTERSVIEVEGEAAGRLYVDRGQDEIRVVDIALLPQFRARGIGERLLRTILDEAAGRGTAVTIHVERGNRARRLYERLGFRAIDTTGVYDLLEWKPSDD